MRYILISAFLLFFFCSCTNSSSNQLELHNKIFFNSSEKEHISQTTLPLSEVYTMYTAEKKSQIPLFKCIEHDDYQLFIGLPIQTNLFDLMRDSVSNELSSQFSTDSSSYYYKIAKHENTYSMEYVQEIDEDLFYLLGISSNEKEFKEHLNLQSVQKRFYQKEN